MEEPNNVSDEEFERKMQIGIDYLKVFRSLLKWRDVIKEKGVNPNLEYTSDEIAKTVEALKDEADYLEGIVRKEFPNT